MNRYHEHLAAFAVILFFLPFKVDVAGISIYLADFLGLASLGVMGIALLRGQLMQSTIQASSFILVFVVYILLNGLINSAPAKLIVIEMIQWLSVAAFLGVLHQAGLLASPRFLSLLALYAFGGALYTAGWHLLQPEYNNFKHLGNTKNFFGFTCALIYLLRQHIKFSHVLLAVGVVLLWMSGERKALLGFMMLVACDHLFCRPFANQRTRQTAIAMGFFSITSLALLLFSIWYLVGVKDILNHFEFTQFDILFADQQQARWDSEVWRKLLLANGFSLFLEHPLFGVGPKMLPEFIAPYFQNQDLVVYTHNFVLDVSVEYGSIGLAILIGGFLLALRRLFDQRMLNPVAFLLAVYILTLVLFVAVNSTIMLMFLLPLFINTRVISPPEPLADPSAHKKPLVKTLVSANARRVSPPSSK